MADLDPIHTVIKRSMADDKFVDIFGDAATPSASEDTDTEFLVQTRQVILLTIVVLSIIATLLMHRGGRLHIFLERVWGIAALILGVILSVRDLYNLFFNDEDISTITLILEVVEQIELLVFVVLAAVTVATLKRQEAFYLHLRTAYWIATIVVVIMFSISAFVELFSTYNLTIGVIGVLFFSLVVSIFMMGDLFVWHFNRRPKHKEFDIGQERLPLLH